MKEKKLNVNRPALSADEIGGYKNFNALQQRYQSVQKFNYVKWGGAGLAAAAVALIVVLTVWKSPSGEVTVAEAFINPPLENVNIAYTGYSVDAAQGDEFTYETGSIIKIPPNAFLDKNGNIVKGKVDVKYREFHDPVDFFLSGIPMTYDSGGTTYNFASAGMLEIVASQNNEPLLVNPSSKIDIAMASEQTEDRYNLYYLDTVKRQWVNKGRDKIVQQETLQVASSSTPPEPEAAFEQLVLPKIESDLTLKELATQRMELESELKEIPKPLEPKKASTDAFVFDFDVSPKEFPEIALYEGMFFQIGEENKNFNPTLYKDTWEDAELRENVKGVNYLLRLKKGGETHEFVVYPVYKGANYGTAIKMYDAKYKEYEATLAQKKEEEKRLKEEYDARMKQLRADAQAKMKEWEARQQKRIEFTASVDKVYRAFQVSGFGIWNCDDPEPMTWKPVIAKFYDKEGNDLYLDYVYVGDRDENMMMAWYPPSFNQFRFNPSGNQVIWGVTRTNKLAVLNEEDFNALVKNAGLYKFKMTTTDQIFTSVGEVKDFLGM